MGETMKHRTLLLSLAVFLPMSVVYAQANNVEKRFMERANAVRDSLGLAPLVNLSAMEDPRSWWPPRQPVEAADFRSLICFNTPTGCWVCPSGCL